MEKSKSKKNMKNDSLSLLKKKNMKKLNVNKFNYLDFVTSLDNDVNKESVYLSIEEIKKIGYNQYHTMYSNNKSYLYNSESSRCNIKEEDKIYGKNFKLSELNGLKIMSWNVHNWVKTCLINNSNHLGRKVEEFVNFIDKYKPDIVCLQEVVPTNAEGLNKNINNYEDLKKINFKYVVQLFEKYGYKYNIISNANIDATYIEDETNYYYLGNAIFSKIVIDKYYNFSIPFNRNIIIAKILYNNRVIYIVNTHLEFKSGILKPQYSKYELYKKLNHYEQKNGFLLNMNILLELLKKIKSKNIIVCGDFNHSYAGNYKLYRFQQGKKIFIPFMKLYKDSTFYPNIFKRATNLRHRDTLATDFIFLNKESQLKIEKSYVLYSELSDHYPVYTSFMF